MPGFIFVILIGAGVGFIARYLYPGPNTPHGFILTTILGIAGASLATFVGQYLNWLEPRHLADPISMVVGAIIILFIWNRLVVYHIVPDPGTRSNRSEPTSGRDT